MSASTDLTGQKFGRLTVIGKADFKDKWGTTLWKCLCDCQKFLPENLRKYTYCPEKNLRSGNTKSCGCYNRDLIKIVGEKNRKVNKYDLSGNCGVGWTTKGEKFLFDLEDYDLLKEFSWHTSTFGYLCAGKNAHNKNMVPGVKYQVYLHKLVLGVAGQNAIVDHINGDILDNRKNNLRIVNKTKNAMNSKLSSTNTSGHKGVCFEKRRGKWLAYIGVNHKSIFLGYFDDYNDAVATREKAEQKYFGEYARAPEFLNSNKDSKIGGG